MERGKVLSSGEGSGENAHATLIHTTILPYVRAEEGTRPGRTRKKPKDLSACEVVCVRHGESERGEKENKKMMERA